MVELVIIIMLIFCSRFKMICVILKSKLFPKGSPLRSLISGHLKVPSKEQNKVSGSVFNSLLHAYNTCINYVKLMFNCTATYIIHVILVTTHHTTCTLLVNHVIIDTYSTVNSERQ